VWPVLLVALQVTTYLATHVVMFLYALPGLAMLVALVAGIIEYIMEEL